jgi:hypothetical protein
MEVLLALFCHHKKGKNKAADLNTLRSFLIKLWPAYIKPLIRRIMMQVNTFDDPHSGRDLARRTSSFIVTFSDLYTA